MSNQDPVSYFTRALSICEQQLGTNHPNTATCLNNLAYLYRTQRKYAETELLYQRLLYIYEHRWPERVQSIRKRYASLLRVMGRDAEAKKLGEEP